MDGAGYMLKLEHLLVQNLYSKFIQVHCLVAE